MNIVFMSMDTLPSTLWARDLYDQMDAERPEVPLPHFEAARCAAAG